MSDIYDDDITEALSDAVDDGEGYIRAEHVRHHLARHGLRIVATENYLTEEEAQAATANGLYQMKAPDLDGFIASVETDAAYDHVSFAAARKIKAMRFGNVP
jgi:hypothetical protein